jgi:hypothetical protein
MKTTVYQTTMDWIKKVKNDKDLELSSYAGNVVNTRSVTQFAFDGNNLKFDLNNPGKNEGIRAYTQKSNKVNIKIVKDPK